MLLSAEGRELIVPGKNLAVSSTQTLERKDLSGSSGNSSFASGGNKPQSLSVSTQVPTADKAQLSILHEYAIALHPTGDPVVYDIVDDVAEVLKIRKVIFCGDMTIAKNDSLQCFDVSFELQEVFSVAEQIEANAAPKIEASESDGETVVATTDPEAINDIIVEVIK